VLNSTTLIKAQTSIGLFGALNLQSISGDAPTDVSYGNKPGYVFGLTAETEIADGIKLVLQPNYTLSQTKIAYDIGERDPKDSMNVKMTFIRIPLLAKIEAFNGVTYFISGFDFGFLQNATIQDENKNTEEKTITDNFESFDFAAMFGAGVKFPINRFQISLEGRYEQSLMNLSKDQNFSSLPERFSLSGFQFLTYLSYNL
jgi:hypothetical protein